MKLRTQRLAALAALALIATPAAAQNTTTGDAGAYPATEQREDDGFPWGLLGLLGLAGLMGLKRKDRDDNYRGTGTGTGTTNR